MNKLNVINQIDTLSNLEEDMMQWYRLPSKFKHMSDDQCLKEHGMTNIQYYNTIRSKLINNAPIYDILDDSIREDYDMFNIETEDEEAHKDRYTYSQLLQQSPYIVILDLEDGNDPEELVAKYQQYLDMPFKYKRWCDYYSYDIYNLTVPDMYRYLTNKLTGDSDEIRMKMRDHINRTYCENNVLDLLIYKSLNYVSVDESYTYRLNENDYNLDFDTVVNKITPYFTPDEYNRFAKNYLIEGLDYREWKDALREAIKENDEQKIIDLGWNPSVLFNEETQEFARDRQISWLKNNAPRVIDIQNLDEQVIFSETLNEETKFMQDLYLAKNLYPVYIVMSYSDTLFGNVERVVKKVKYTHAGLCFDNSLSEIFTFSFGKDWNGFITDSIKDYINNSKKSIISLICIFVDEETRNKMYNTINYLQDHKERTKYGFGNLINILLNRAKKFPYPENLSMVCSQFVDMMLKLVNIDITHKSSNLVIPEDFNRACNPKYYVYKVYEGLCTKYNPNKVEYLVKKLFYNNKIENIRYPHTPIPISFVSESDKESYNKIIDEIKDILTPRNMFDMDVRFSTYGDLEVNLLEYIKSQTADIEQTLDSYEEDNIEGMKKEIAYLFYLNTLVEDVIHKKKKDDDEYSRFVVSRGYIILLFRKYLKKIQAIDREFDFIEYYKNSEYNMEIKALDDIKMKYSGEDIKKTLRAIENFKSKM